MKTEALSQHPAPSTQHSSDPHLARALKLAEVTARRMLRPYTAPTVEEEDLVSEAYLAVLRWMPEWDERRSSRDTHAIARARWAVQEFLRRQDYLPRAVRQLACEEPDNPRFLPPACLEELACQEDEQGILHADRSPAVPDETGLAIARADLTRAWGLLCASEQEVLTLRIRCHLSYRQIGERLDRSESRVQQIVASAREKLAPYLIPQDGPVPQEETMSITLSQRAGEGRATYENVYDYLLANCVVEEHRLEWTLERDWAKALLAAGLAFGECAEAIGSKIAYRLGWEYRDGKGWGRP